MPKTPRRTNSCQGAQTPRQRELNTKRRGELAEIAFAHKAIAEGFAVSRPFGDSERYDLMVDSGVAQWRVQIKCSSTVRDGFYRVSSHRRTPRGVISYLPSEVDFLVAYIIPEDTWFILPVTLDPYPLCLLIKPESCRRSEGHYGPYREAWDLLRAPRKCRACGCNV
jgi:PD-(D/E)XK endonuclease